MCVFWSYLSEKNSDMARLRPHLTEVGEKKSITASLTRIPGGYISAKLKQWVPGWIFFESKSEADASTQQCGSTMVRIGSESAN